MTLYISIYFKLFFGETTNKMDLNNIQVNISFLQKSDMIPLWLNPLGPVGQNLVAYTQLYTDLGNRMAVLEGAALGALWPGGPCRGGHTLPQLLGISGTDGTEWRLSGHDAELQGTVGPGIATSRRREAILPVMRLCRHKKSWPSCLNLGQLWGIIPAPEVLLGVHGGFVERALQAQSHPAHFLPMVLHRAPPSKSSARSTLH